MKIHIHATCWNEIDMLPFFFRQYDPIVSRYFIYDDGSDDGSLQLLLAHPKVTVMPFELGGDSIIESAFARVNSLWWPSRNQADWVLVCNVDEFFWHKDLPGYLQDCTTNGTTFLQAEGYQMISETFPPSGMDLTQFARSGARFKNMDKPAFFNPNEITDSGFGIARHSCMPVGNVVRPEKDEILLLHYKHLGVDYVFKRHEELRQRLRAGDRARNFGHHYSPETTRQRHDSYLEAAQELFSLQEAQQARAHMHNFS